MKTLQDPQSSAEVQLSSLASHETQGDQQNSIITEAPVEDSGSISMASSDNRKISREDIELVQNLIERCLQQYMNRAEVVQILSNRARIEPGFTTLVSNLPGGYTVIQHPPVSATGHPHLYSMGCAMSSCHVVNGIPAPGGFHAIRMNSGNNMMERSGTSEVVPPCSSISTFSEVSVSPTSLASNNHFPFTPSELSGMGMDTSAVVDTTFTSDAADGAESSRNSFRPLGQLWNFSLTDLTNLGDLGPLENYSGSPFLPSDSEILLDSPEHDDIVEGFFADTGPGLCSQSDDEQS